jgi:hypothetical protein
MKDDGRQSIAGSVRVTLHQFVPCGFANTHLAFGTSAYSLTRMNPQRPPYAQPPPGGYSGPPNTRPIPPNGLNPGGYGGPGGPGQPPSSGDGRPYSQQQFPPQSYGSNQPPVRPVGYSGTPSPSRPRPAPPVSADGLSSPGPQYNYGQYGPSSSGPMGPGQQFQRPRPVSPVQSLGQSGPPSYGNMRPAEGMGGMQSPHSGYSQPHSADGMERISSGFDQMSMAAPNDAVSIAIVLGFERIAMPIAAYLSFSFSKDRPC